MNLLKNVIKKTKDILFDEEELVVNEKPKVETMEQPRQAKKVVEEPIRTRETFKRVENTPSPVMKPIIEDELPVIEKIEVPKPIVEEPIIKKENKSPFMDFDDDEFGDTIRFTPEVKQAEVEKPKQNVIKYERKQKIEKRYDYGNYSKVETTEIKSKSKFTPSLIISPVYGILNQDYIPSDIKHKEEDVNLDIEKVRKKAYGELEKIEKELSQTDDLIYEETKITREEKHILNDEEIEFVTKEIKTVEEFVNKEEIKAEIKEEPLEEIIIEHTFSDMDLIKDIEKEIDTPINENTFEEITEEDTLENDLFDLIDSMYESKEEI